MALRLVTPLPTSGQGEVANNSNSFRVYPGYSGITVQENATNGTYSGFQTGVRIQNRWGLSGELDYTWSHEIDIQTYDNSCCVSNPWYLKYDKGSGTLDRRNMLNANYMYKLPLFAQEQRIGSLAGGWMGTGRNHHRRVRRAGSDIVTSGADTIGLGGGYTNRLTSAAK